MKTSFQFLIILSFFIYSPIYSQEKWFAEFRPGINFPTNDEEIRTGWGLELAVGYNFIPHLGAYVGWGLNEFKSDDNLFNINDKYTLLETGYTYGIQWVYPISGFSDLSYAIRLGGIYNHLELENSNGKMIDDSGHGFGWEVGAGLELELGMNWNIRPQLGYRSLKRKIETESFSNDFNLNYLSLGLKIGKSF